MNKIDIILGKLFLKLLVYTRQQLSFKVFANEKGNEIELATINLPTLFMAYLI